MKDGQQSQYDYRASKQKLVLKAQSLIVIVDSPKLEKRSLRSLKHKINKLVGELKDEKWQYVAQAFDTDDYEINEQGYRVTVDNTYKGRYRVLCSWLKELEATIDREIETLPDIKPIKYVVDCLLHLMYECGENRPSLYDEGPAVNELTSVLHEVGIDRTQEHARRLITEALERFDPACEPYGFSEILVLNQ